MANVSLLLQGRLANAPSSPTGGSGGGGGGSSSAVATTAFLGLDLREHAVVDEHAIFQGFLIKRGGQWPHRWQRRFSFVLNGQLGADSLLRVVRGAGR